VTATWEGLAGALAGVPKLHGARCAGLSWAFDETDNPEIVEYAINLCGTCPALAGCKEYFYSLPPRKRPSGIVAGINTNSGTNRKTAA
jgi:WhiB family redox-sensing transcriptional regulator